MDSHQLCLRRFHDIEPLQGLEMMQQSELSILVVSKSLRTVPYPLLGENTMVLSDSMILAPDEQGRLSLMFRCCPASSCTSHSHLPSCHLQHCCQEP